MEYKIIISKKDLASLTIYEALKKINFTENVHVIQERTIYTEDIDKKYPADFIIFPTKHQSESLKKTLSVHNPGNWGKAELGGKDSTLPPSNSIILKNALLELKKLNNLDYEVSGEVTHHGPNLSTPSLFIEIGSSPLQWKDEEAALIIAKTIKSIIKNPHPTNYQTAIGIGGGHYMPSFNKIIERTNISLSFICPKHNLESLNENILKQAIEKTKSYVDFLLVDWKGVGEHKEKIKKLAEKINLPLKRVDQVLKEA